MRLFIRVRKDLDFFLFKFGFANLDSIENLMEFKNEEIKNGFFSNYKPYSLVRI
jgi:hypothetical protein